MGCWGTRGFLHLLDVFTWKLERNFQKKHESYAELTLERNLKTSWSVLYFTELHFDKLQHKLFYNCKVLENMTYFKEHFILNHLETNSLIYFSNSLIIHQAKTKEITSVKEVWIPDLN